MAIIYKSRLNIRKRTIEAFRTFEHIECTLKICKSYMRIVIMYRPPPYVVMYRPPPYVVMYRPPPYVVMYCPPPYVVMYRPPPYVVMYRPPPYVVMYRPPPYVVMYCPPPYVVIYRPPPYVVMYRPPPSAKSGLTTSAFFGEWGRFIDQHVLQPGPLIVIGERNFHLDDKAGSDARRLIRSLDSTGMEMHVHGSTYRKGHMLDVLLTRCMDEYVASTDMGISDHSAIKFTISAARCRAALMKIKYRKLRAINADILRQDIPVLRPEDFESLSVDELVNHYDATLVNLVETHAPLLEKNVRMRPDTAWYNDHKQMFREQCKLLNDMQQLS